MNVQVIKKLWNAVVQRAIGHKQSQVILPEPLLVEFGNYYLI